MYLGRNGGQAWAGLCFRGVMVATVGGMRVAQSSRESEKAFIFQPKFSGSKKYALKNRRAAPVGWHETRGEWRVLKLQICP